MEFEKEKREEQLNIQSENVNQNTTTEEKTVDRHDYEEENKQLKEKIAELENQLKEIQNAARLIKATFENYKMDSERQLKEVSKNTSLRILRTLIPIIDDFKRAFSYFEKSGDLEEFYNGTRKIFEKFTKILENEGLKTIEASGKFDPFNHEAMEREERDDVEEYTILEVLEDGYIYNGQVIKPAKVKVAIKPRKKETQDENNANS